MKDPLAPLFFWLNQADRLEIKQISFDEMDLNFRHATPLKINRDSREMRGRGIALGRGRIPIVATKLPLPHYGTDGGIHLDLIVKLAVINFPKVCDEVASPGPAKTTRRIEPWVETHSFIGFDWNQIVRCL